MSVFNTIEKFFTHVADGLYEVFTPMERPTINTAAVLKAVEDGYVRVQYHPKLPLAILNYTEKTQFEGRWDDTTRRCRGLVVAWDIFSEEMKIIIESPQKFFNHNEEHAPDISGWKFDDMWVSEKLDGYYISIRNDSQYGLIVTSRGAFDSVYALLARGLLYRWQDLPQNTNFFCELCATIEGDEGVIVTKHPETKLVCWGVNDRVPTQSDPMGWPYEIAKEVTQPQLAEYMRGDVEGVVIFNKNTGERIKFKTDWYIKMHRLVSNCTFRRTLDIVCGGGQIGGATETTYTDKSGEECTIQISALPEEHLRQMCEWEKQIRAEFLRVSLLVSDDYLEYKDRTPKEYALESQSEPYIKSLVFRRFKGDGADMDEAVWKTVRKLLEKSNDK